VFFTGNYGWSKDVSRRNALKKRERLKDERNAGRKGQGGWTCNIYDQKTTHPRERLEGWEDLSHEPAIASLNKRWVDEESRDSR